MTVSYLEELRTVRKQLNPCKKRRLSPPKTEKSIQAIEKPKFLSTEVHFSFPDDPDNYRGKILDRDSVRRDWISSIFKVFCNLCQEKLEFFLRFLQNLDGLVKKHKVDEILSIFLVETNSIEMVALLTSYLKSAYSTEGKGSQVSSRIFQVYIDDSSFGSLSSVSFLDIVQTILKKLTASSQQLHPEVVDAILENSQEFPNYFIKLSKKIGKIIVWCIFPNSLLDKTGNKLLKWWETAIRKSKLYNIKLILVRETFPFEYQRLPHINMNGVRETIFNVLLGMKLRGSLDFPYLPLVALKRIVKCFNSGTYLSKLGTIIAQYTMKSILCSHHLSILCTIFEKIFVLLQLTPLSELQLGLFVRELLESADRKIWINSLMLAKVFRYMEASSEIKLLKIVTYLETQIPNFGVQKQKTNLQNVSSSATKSRKRALEAVESCTGSSTRTYTKSQYLAQQIRSGINEYIKICREALISDEANGYLYSLDEYTSSISFQRKFVSMSTKAVSESSCGVEPTIRQCLHVLNDLFEREETKVRENEFWKTLGSDDRQNAKVLIRFLGIQPTNGHTNKPKKIHY